MADILKFDNPIRVGNRAAAPSGSAAGVIYYDTVLQELRWHNGSTFTKIADYAQLSAVSGAALIGFDDSSVAFTADDVQEAIEGLDTIVAAHLNGAASKHDASEIDYERSDGSKKNISAGSDDVENALSNLDDAIGLLDSAPTNYTPVDPAIVADHLAAIDLALASAGTDEFGDDVFRIKDDSDPTKKIAFQASGIATGQTRTITVPNANVDLGNLTNSNISASAAIAYSKLNLTGAILNADLAAGIDAVKIADGSVSNAEFETLDGVTSSIQDQLDSKQDTSEKGQANGYASLDGSGKVPVSQLPNSIMEYQGMWDASTNDPELADGAGSAGDVYRVSVAGTVDFGSGNIVFEVGDYAIYNGSTWEKADTTDAVSSVNGMQGAVVLDTGDISENGNLYFTDERAQDAVGSILTDSSKIDFDYNDGSNTISATIVAGSLVNADINASAAIAYSKLDLTGAIQNADLAAGIDAVKIANGSVSNTEFQYLDGVTSSIQDQLDAKLENVSEDTDPQLGGDLDLNGKSLVGPMHRASVAAPTKYIEDEYVHSVALTGSTTAVASAFTFDSKAFKAESIEYTIVSGNERRVGTLKVVANNASGVASTVVSLIDSSTETADIEVSWSAAMSGDNCQLSYTTGAGAKTMRADIKRFRAAD